MVWARLEALLRGELGIRGRIALHEPLFAGEEARWLLHCLDSGWVSTAGPEVDRLEAALAGLCGVDHAFATNCGTAALHLALLAVGVGPGDLVVCPAISFVATANAIRYCGAEPLFADVDPDTLCLDPVALEHGLDAWMAQGAGRTDGRSVRAVIAMHAFGHPADMDAIGRVAARRGLPVVEDAAEAVGSRYRGRPCGGLGRVGILSFNGNKLVTTGGGGAVLTDDPDIARTVRHLGSTARRHHPTEIAHDAVGYNYRMPNLNAALGCAQLAALPGLLARKRDLAARYAAALAGIPGAALLAEQPWAESNHWLPALRLEDGAARDRLLTLARAAGVDLRPCWTPLPDLPMYAHAPRLDGLATARDLAGRLVNLPGSPGLVPAGAAL